MSRTEDFNVLFVLTYWGFSAELSGILKIASQLPLPVLLFLLLAEPTSDVIVSFVHFSQGIPLVVAHLLQVGFLEITSVLLLPLILHEFAFNP